MTAFGLLRSPAEVRFGPGSRRELARLASGYGRTAMVLVDPGLEGVAAVGETVDSLGSAGLDATVFGGIHPELPVSEIAEAEAAGSGIGPELIVAIGGGSTIDLAKILSLLLRHGGEPSDYYGENAVPGPGLPVIAAPTTAGTGSEVTPVAVVTDPAVELKVGISSPHLIPRVAVCDPELTLTCPGQVTAHAGIDALGHAIEAFLARRHGSEAPPDRVFVGKNEISDRLAIAAIESIGASLAGAVEHGDSIRHRSGMLFGSMMAGLAFGSAGTGLAHALQYPVGGRTHTPHGLGIGLLLPFAMRYSLEPRGPELAAIATALGREGGEPMDAVETVRELGAAIGIPASLAELGVEAGELRPMAEQAVTISRLIDNTARPVSADDALEVLESAHAGSIAPTESMEEA